MALSRLAPMIDESGDHGVRTVNRPSTMRASRKTSQSPHPSFVVSFWTCFDVSPGKMRAKFQSLPGGRSSTITGRHMVIPESSTFFDMKERIP
jgi:hypothetical protein